MNKWSLSWTRWELLVHRNLQLYNHEKCASPKYHLATGFHYITITKWCQLTIISFYPFLIWFLNYLTFCHIANCHALWLYSILSLSHFSWLALCSGLHHWSPPLQIFSLKWTQNYFALLFWLVHGGSQLDYKIKRRKRGIMKKREREENHTDQENYKIMHMDTLNKNQKH